MFKETWPQTNHHVDAHLYSYISKRQLAVWVLVMLLTNMLDVILNYPPLHFVRLLSSFSFIVFWKFLYIAVPWLLMVHKTYLIFLTCPLAIYLWPPFSYKVWRVLHFSQHKTPFVLYKYTIDKTYNFLSMYVHTYYIIYVCSLFIIFASRIQSNF